MARVDDVRGPEVARPAQRFGQLGIEDRVVRVNVDGRLERAPRLRTYLRPRVRPFTNAVYNLPMN